MVIVVDGSEAHFELCDLGDGYWAATGRLPDAEVTIGSHGVPLDLVRLEHIAWQERRAVPMPDLAASTDAVVRDLDSRFARVPFRRVRRMSHYGALRAVEKEHIRLLAGRYGLGAEEQAALSAYWLSRIEVHLAPVLDRLEAREDEVIERPWLVRRLRWGFVFQLWFNTFGEGGRTWLGNRGIGNTIFRMHWSA
jgi:hypothetical protein